MLVGSTQRGSVSRKEATPEQWGKGHVIGDTDSNLMQI